MSEEKGKIAGVETSKFIDAVGRKFKEKLPHIGIFPSSNVKVAAGNSPDGKISQAQVLITMDSTEMVKYLGLCLGKDSKQSEMMPKILMIGNERIKDGLFLIHSSLEGRMIKIKFGTIPEAKSYMNHFDIKHYSIVRTKMSVSEDLWFSGDFENSYPEKVGYRDIDRRSISNDGA